MLYGVSHILWNQTLSFVAYCVVWTSYILIRHWGNLILVKEADINKYSQTSHHGFTIGYPNLMHQFLGTHYPGKALLFMCYMVQSPIQIGSTINLWTWVSEVNKSKESNLTACHVEAAPSCWNQIGRSSSLRNPPISILQDRSTIAANSLKGPL